MQENRVSRTYIITGRASYIDRDLFGDQNIFVFWKEGQETEMACTREGETHADKQMEKLLERARARVV